MNQLSKLTLCGVLSAGILSAQAQLAVHLLVDVSDPAAVKITATPALALAAETGVTTTYDGVTLGGFFTADAGGALGGLATSTLKAAGTSGAFDSWSSVDWPASAAPRGLNLYASGAGEPQMFLTATPPFTGQATVDFDAPGLSGHLPAVSSTGGVFTGPGDGILAVGGTQIGTWQVVPEPETWGVVSLAVVGVAGVVLRRRRPA